MTKWYSPKKYWLRVIGWFIAFGGVGFIADELYQGTIDFSKTGHEHYGILCIFVGYLLHRAFPKGKAKS